MCRVIGTNTILKKKLCNLPPYFVPCNTTKAFDYETLFSLACDACDSEAVVAVQ